MRSIYKSSIRLENSRAVMRLIARTINLLNDGMIEDGKARTIGYLCNIMLRGFEVCDLEKRIEELEKVAYEEVSA